MHRRRIRIPLLLEQPPHLPILRIRPANPHTKSPRPPRSPHHPPHILLPHRRAHPSKPARTLRHPAPAGEVGECEPENEQKGAGVGWVPDVCVEPGCDEFVGRVDGEVECEELAEGFEAVEANVGAEEDGENAEEEGGG
jgi:hypothetical protein